MNYPEGNVQHTGHGESLKSRTLFVIRFCWLSGMQDETPEYQLNRITSTKCHINTDIPSDDGPEVVRNI